MIEKTKSKRNFRSSAVISDVIADALGFLNADVHEGQIGVAMSRWTTVASATGSTRPRAGGEAIESLVS